MLTFLFLSHHLFLESSECAEAAAGVSEPMCISYAPQMLLVNINACVTCVLQGGGGQEAAIFPHKMTPILTLVWQASPELASPGFSAYQISACRGCGRQTTAFTML